MLLALDCFGLLRPILAVDCAVRASSPLKTTRQMHYTTRFFVSHGSCRPFVFLTLRIAFPANPLYSHPYELPGVPSVFSVPRPQLLVVLRFPHSSPCVFSNLHALLRSLGSFCGRVPLFSVACALFGKNTRGYGGQRGRGRSGGRAVSGRGRMRKRGPSGGGTLRRESPQHGQRPSSQNARVASARSQWPRASHCGLMHCTVKPGRNCISFPSQRPARFCGAGRVAQTRIPQVTDECWRRFCRSVAVLSSGNTTIYSGPVA